MLKEYYSHGYREALEKLGFDPIGWVKGLGQGPGAAIGKSISAAAGATPARNASAGMAAAGRSVSTATGAGAKAGGGIPTAGGR